MMSSLLNDTMVNATFTMSDFEHYSGLIEVIFSWFSPGINIGFVALIILSIAFHEHPNTPMLGVVGAYLGTLVWYNNVGVWTFLVSYWLKIIGYVFGYVLVGAAWTVPRWWIYVRKDKVHEKFKGQFETLVKRSTDEGQQITDDVKYQAALQIVKENKFRFYTWMAWWPLNIVYTLTRDPLTILYNWLYAKLTNTFAKILIAAFEDSKEVKEVKEAEVEVLSLAAVTTRRRSTRTRSKKNEE